MSAWSNDELRKIAGSEELNISPLREDRATYGKATTIWSVAVDGALYVRAGNGRRSRWYGAAMREKAGRIAAGGLTKDVSFEPIDGPINDRIDEAYRTKYRDSPYLNPMLAEAVRAATIRVMPRTTEPGSPEHRRMTP
jgi:hypothetical protein